MSDGTITGLLERFHEGDRTAFNEMVPLVYAELRRIAHARRGEWRGDETMGTTALCHEAYLKLVDHQGDAWSNRSHFLRVASRAMRQILVDYARARRAQRRGGGLEHVPVDQVEELVPAASALTPARIDTLLDIEEALPRLSEQHGSRVCDVVECRFFGGMTIQETAEALSVSPATVKRDWLLAQAWLYRLVAEWDDSETAG
jgi:RNA polymerase sigma factor (TIGR02999 family)